MIHRLVAGLSTMAALLACPAPVEAAPSEAWVRECPGEAFCFQRPGGLVRQPGQAIDSLAANYQSADLFLSFDMGRYGQSLDHLVKPVKRLLLIDGRPAELLSSEHEIVLVIAEVHPGQRGPVKFHMALKSKGRVSDALALKLFQSIQFKPLP